MAGALFTGRPFFVESFVIHLRNMFRNFRRYLILFLGLWYLVPVRLGWTDDPQKVPVRPPFAIPPRYGAITDLYFAPGSSNGNVFNLERASLVVLIQDLHANVGVQKNIAAILYRLNRIHKGPGVLVCVEGASGEGDVSLLRSLPGPIRHGFEAMLLHKAYLTGAELAATEAAADWPQQQVVIWSEIKSW